MKAAPPRLAESLMTWSLGRTDRHAVLGDLAEEFLARAERDGAAAARAWYWRQLRRSLLSNLRRRGAQPLDSRAEPRHAPVLQTLGRDLRLAVRSLSAARTHAVIALVTLALGVGLISAVFSVLDSVLLHPLPFPDADRLATLTSYDIAGKFWFEGMPSAVIVEWGKQTDLFDRVDSVEAGSFVFTDEHGSEMVAGSLVSPGLLTLLGAVPAAGRLFVDGDGRSGTNHLAIVSERFARSQLHMADDLAAIGRTVVLDGDAYAIVGVLPASFRFPDAIHDLWLPYDAQAPPAATTGSTLQPPTRLVVPVARLKPGVWWPQAVDQVAARGVAVDTAAGDGGRQSARLSPFGAQVDDDTRTSLFVLIGAVGFLLLIVCTNLANLALSRAVPRAHGLAVRAALGASRADLVRETLVENLLVGLAGCVAGLGVAAFGVRAAVAVMPSEMTTLSYNPVALDGRVLAFTILSGLLTALLFGLPPAIVASRASVTDVLRRDARVSSGSVLSRRLRSAIVVTEVSLAIVLLVGAALMTRSFMKLQSVDKGLDTTGLVAMRIDLPSSGYADAGVQTQFVAGVMDRIRTMPGVSGVTTGGVPPESTSGIKFGPVLFAHQPDDPAKNLMIPVYEVPADFFSTLGIRLKQGHAFRADDPEGAVVISENFARAHWPNGQAVGGRFKWVSDDGWLTVIGVASTVRRASTAGMADRPQLYLLTGHVTNLAHPVRPWSMIASSRTIVVRAADPAAVIPRLPQAVHDVDPHVVVGRRDLVEHLFADAVARPRIVFAVMSVLALFGLVLAAGGIYGVLSCLVSQRLREIGIRVALGASRLDVGRIVVGNGLGLTLIGIVVGVSASMALGRVMRTLLYQVEPSDPWSVALVSALVLAVAWLAAWRPARRAMRVDPVNLLREE